MEPWAQLLGNGLDAVSTLGVLLAAFIFGQMLSWTYEYTYQGLSYSRGFAQSLVLVTLSAATVVVAMAHSILVGLGLLGILSLVRFRSTLKAPRDLIFVLGAATAGASSGVNALFAATAGTLAFCATAIYLHQGAFGARARFDGVLRFRVSSEQTVEPRLGELLEQHCRRRVPLSQGEVAQGARVEHAYQVKFRSPPDAQRLLTALRSDLDVGDARLLMQEATFEY